ncbi:MAG: M13 family metallopeptidase [Sphingomonas sp.]|uniref:M13 family metallopeptidase n=1 Tax=Sphingomonas sp. TaxID=28214 RepID=UPI0017C6D6A8|nr:M13 family metallopeptidase [Sphingomonas sp.]MBA3667420.1 M13 family metallopeptidase [Sphingomonas sp.]
MTIRTALLASGASLAIAFSALPAAAQPVKPAYGTWGYAASAMDSSVKPGDGFWAYVNGGWDKRTPIAPDRAGAGVGVVVSDQAEAQVRAIVEELADNPTGSRLAQQVGDTYGSWMDVPTMDKLGAAPLKPYLARIKAVKTRSQLLGLFVEQGYAAPIDVGILPNPSNPKEYVAAVGQATLGLPSREYYLSPEPKMVGYRAAYRQYIQTIQQLAGLSGGVASADRIIALETALSEAQWPAAERRDLSKILNRMDRAKMTALAPQFAWVPTLKASGLGNIGTVYVLETSAVAGAGKLLASVPLSTWKEWMAFRFASDHAAALSTALDTARFDFYSKQLNGVAQQRDRWKRGVQLVNGALGEGVGQIYVERHYPATSDAQMAELITNLRAAYQERISAAKWMDEATRTEALAKLAAFDPRTGHPQKYIDYSSMMVKRGDVLGNSLRSAKFDWALQLSRLPNPVDRSLWGMTPQTVNAYYSPFQNQITFPAAILQPPYFDPNADPALNYGAIGAVIGHEMGHGFDDQGRKFDAAGKYRDWWTPATAKAYTDRAAMLAKQFDSYEPIPGLHVNGKLTLGENLGDLGGIEAAYGAYRKYVAAHGEPPVIDGLTGNQRFFIAFAQAWQSKIRDEASRQRLLTDPHSPAKYRVDGIVRNFDPWYAAFNVQPGDKLYLPPEQRVHVW